MLYSSERRFKLWDYNVGHNQLLLRSPSSLELELEKNIDVVFLGVEFLHLPSTLPGLQLQQASAKETAKIVGDLIKVGECCTVYTILSGNRRYYVAAVAFMILENDLDLTESSLETGSDSNDAKEPGRMLVHS